ncbi:hypothetical protein [Nocardia sp. NPDC004711]
MLGRFDPRRRRAEPVAPEKAGAADDVELTDIVAALHFDLAEWLGSDAPPKVFDRISGALDGGFTSVVTTGQAVDRETFLAGIWSARNVLSGVEIEVSEVAEIARSGQLIVVRFDAENRIGAVKTGRRTVTAVLVTDGRTYLWRTVHETPVPETAQPIATEPPAGAPPEQAQTADEEPAEGSAVEAGGDVAVGADEQSGGGGEPAAVAEGLGELGSGEEDVAGPDQIECGAAVG